MLKCQFHCHTGEDPREELSYFAKDIIKKAAELNFDVLAITLHNKFFFNEEINEYAKKHKVILLPSIELEINKKHILCINIDKNIEKIKSFKDLKNYKNLHPNCLIIAAHPFFPGKTTLKKDLIKNIEIFDAIEHSFAYTKKINYNKKAIETAKKYDKPLIATSDCHFLNDLENGFSFVDSPKNIKSIINAVKNNKIKMHRPTNSVYSILKGLVLIEIAKIKKLFKNKASLL